MRIRSLLYGLLALTLTVGLAGCDSGGDNGGNGGNGGDAVVTVDSLVSSNSSFSTLNQALDAAGVTALDDENTNYTVFAPTNDAFGALNTDALLGSEALGSVLQYHVIEGDSLGAAELSDEQTLTTLAGQDLTVEVDGSGNVSVEGSPVTDADITADNGVIHGIGDKPLLGNQPLTNVLQFVASTQALTQEIVSRNLQNEVGGSDVGTVFAPSNTAINNNSGRIDGLSDQQVQAVLQYHTLGSQERLADLQSQLDGGQVTLTTRLGEDLVIAEDSDGNVVFNPDGQGGAQATLETDSVNYVGTNNVTHVINGLLIPPNFGDGGGASYEVVANESNLDPGSGNVDAQCLVELSSGELVFFNNQAGGIFVWDGSSLTTHRSASDLNSDVPDESNTFDRCDGVTTADGFVYFILRNSESNLNYVYRTDASDPGNNASTAFNGANAVAANASTVYIGSVAALGGDDTVNGIFQISSDLSGSATEVASDGNVNPESLDLASDGTLYGFSSSFGDDPFSGTVFSLDVTASSPSISQFTDPYAGDSPLTASDFGGGIDDLQFVNAGGTSYLVVSNGGGSEYEWGAIEVSSQSVSLLFEQADLESNLSVGGYAAFTAPMTANSDGEVFVASGGESGPNYIARIANSLQ